MYDIQRWQQWLTKSAKHAGGVQQGTAEETWEEEVFLATASVSMWPCKNISHIEVLVINFFSNPTHKTETGTASRGETTNTNPHKSTNQTIYPIRSSTEQSINTIWLCLLDWKVPRLVQSSEKLYMFSGYYQYSSGFTRFDWWAWIQEIPVQGHILSIGGDAVSLCIRYV
jgi:hypothetical protein